MYRGLISRSVPYREEGPRVFVKDGVAGLLFGAALQCAGFTSRVPFLFSLSYSLMSAWGRMDGVLLEL